MRFEQVKNDLKAAMSAQAPKTSGYDTRAEVLRVEGDKAWVHIPGGVDETPVALTIDAKEGDQVQVRVAGGSAWLVGNASAPPTDDRTAIAARLQADAAKLAADAAQEDIDAQQEHFWHDEFGAHVLSGTNATGTRYRTDVKGAGQTISAIDPDGVETVVAVFGADGIQIGEEVKSHLEMDYHSLQLKDKDGNIYFHVSDLRDEEGKAELTETFPADSGTSNTFTLSYPATQILSVSYYTMGIFPPVTGDIDSSHYTYTSSTRKLALQSPYNAGSYLTSSYVYIVQYETRSDQLKAFTFGTRESTHDAGYYSVSMGRENINTAKGYTLGHNLINHTDYAVVFGKYNDPDSDAALTIGRGTSDGARANAFAVDWAGKILAGATNALLFDAIGTAIPSGANLNNYDVGYYVAASNTIAASLSNCPTSVAFIMIVLQRAAGRPIQIILDNNAGLHIRARQSDSAWSNWSTK